MPKSSIASRTPIALRRSSTAVAASGSAITALSVISRQSSSGARPGRPRASPRTIAGERLVGELARGDVDADAERRGRARAPRSPAWRQASSSTYAPIATIRPVCSAIGMNAAGADQPALRVLPAQQRLGADDPAAGELDLRLVDDPQLVALERVRGARPRGRAARRRARASTRRRPRSAPCPAPWRGTWRRRRRAAAPRGRRRRRGRCGRRSSRSRSAGGPRARPARAARSARRSATRRAAVSPPTGIVDRELVAAEAGDHVAGPQHAAHALRDDLRAGGRRRRGRASR